jgi:choline dehydrogenase
VDETFDVVVVGAGASGCVIAARLVEDEGRRVLLIEAGPDYPNPAELAPDLADARRNSMRRHDWGLWHVPWEGWTRLPLPRGKVVGGSSAVNTCIALRGEPEDYDEWAARGLPEWGWDQCLPAFKRLERDLDFDDDVHGRDGPLPIRRDPPSAWVPWQAGFVAAAERLGLPRREDANRPGTTGVAPLPFNRIEGRRVSAAEAWLTPTVRQRLTLWPGTLVRRVLFERGVVVGVEAQTGRQVRVVRAPKVVLCAGALHTPGLLLRSGVGPRAEVEALGVAPVADLPVARRLLDHPGSALFLRPRRGVASQEHPLMQIGYRFTTPGSPVPNNMQIQPGSNVAFPWMNVPFVTLMGHVGKPRGFGTLRWRSADPAARPEIRSRLLVDPHDRALMLASMRLAMELAHTPELRALATPLWPKADVVRDPVRGDAWIRGATDSGYHPCGTAPMGADDDPDAVCDGRGRVRRVEGLIVGDASLMPTIPSSNIHLAVLMIGERIAEWLRAG